jgi:hypothetical protein
MRRAARTESLTESVAGGPSPFEPARTRLVLQTSIHDTTIRGLLRVDWLELAGR